LASREGPFSVRKEPRVIKRSHARGRATDGEGGREQGDDDAEGAKKEKLREEFIEFLHYRYRLAVHRYTLLVPTLPGTTPFK
jgi:hypothetical protein